MWQFLVRPPCLHFNSFSSSHYYGRVVRIARERGYRIETNKKNNLPQINFGLKKLHLGQIMRLYPDVLLENAKVNKLIAEIAPGRPCAHKPFREIIEQIHREKDDKLE